MTLRRKACKRSSRSANRTGKRGGAIGAATKPLSVLLRCYHLNGVRFTGGGLSFVAADSTAGTAACVATWRIGARTGTARGLGAAAGATCASSNALTDRGNASTYNESPIQPATKV